MVATVFVSEVRLALRICIERLEVDSRDYFFYALDGYQHIALFR